MELNNLQINKELILDDRGYEIYNEQMEYKEPSNFLDTISNIPGLNNLSNLNFVNNDTNAVVDTITTNINNIIGNNTNNNHINDKTISSNYLNFNTSSVSLMFEYMYNIITSFQYYDVGIKLLPTIIFVTILYFIGLTSPILSTLIGLLIPIYLVKNGIELNGMGNNQYLYIVISYCIINIIAEIMGFFVDHIDYFRFLILALIWIGYKNKHEYIGNVENGIEHFNQLLLNMKR